MDSGWRAKRHWGATVVVAVWLSLAGSARGDSLIATRDQPLRETRHVVDLSIEDGVATYRVRRTFLNGGTRAEEARLTIELPYGAAATGLRIKAGNRWYAGDLMHAEKAEELYRELTGLGPSRPKDPALLYWRWPSELALRVFPILPGKPHTIEYTLTAPTEYDRGVYYVSYGREPVDENLTAPVVRLDPALRPVSLDGQAQRSRKMVLGDVQVHPLLRDHGIQDDRVLVRPLRVRARASEAIRGVAVEVHAEHTWQGDLQLDLISPSGLLLPVRSHDFSLDDNALRETFIVDWQDEIHGTWHLLVTDHHPLDAGVLRRWSLRAVDGEGQPLAGSRPSVDARPAAIPQPSEGDADMASIAVAPVHASDTATQLRLGRVALLPDKHFTRVQLDVARTLTPLPRGQSVVFVIDASHTMGRDGIEGQLRLARAYLSHVHDARFALVGYRRKAVVWSDFAPAAAFDTRVAALAEATRAPNNGSFLDAGAALGVQLLNQVAGPKALVLMTDDRLRPAWSNAKALPHIGSLPLEATVHLVELGKNGEPDLVELERNDSHRLFPLAKRRGGVAVVGSGFERGKRSMLRDEVLYLVRPNRLDYPSFSTPIEGLSLEASLTGGAIAEGESFRFMNQVPAAPTALALSGQLWSREVSYQAVTAEPFNRATAAFVFSLDHYDDLSPLEQLSIAMYAGAVSPVTSYLAVEPGVRPSTEGLQRGATAPRIRMGKAGVGMGSIGLGSATSIDWKKIAWAVRDACRHVRADEEVALITLDYQDHEIADVRRRSAPAPYLDCVVEAMWKQQLPVHRWGDHSMKMRL